MAAGNAMLKETPAFSEKMQQALASLALEGITLSPEALTDLQLLDSGKMTEAQFLEKTLAIARFEN